MKVLVFDPSGNHKEGNGTTGWAMFLNGALLGFGEIKAADFKEPEAYWFEHDKLITKLRPDVVVYETYALQAGRAMQQSWSHLETPQLIGTIRMSCWAKGIKCVGQSPSIKPRFSDQVLVNIGVAEKRPGGHYIKGERTSMHIRDAIRHGLYYIRYGDKKCAQ